MQELHNCTLEWDEDRGVLYVHNNANGTTVLRICRMPKPANPISLLDFGSQIDVTMGAGVHYTSIESASYVKD